MCCECTNSLVGLCSWRQSVAQLQKSGVKVLMVTGDSKETAVAIARRCGILEGSHATSSDQEGDSTTFRSISVLPEDSSEEEYLDLNSFHPIPHNPLDDVEYGAEFALSGSQLVCDFHFPFFRSLRQSCCFQSF